MTNYRTLTVIVAVRKDCEPEVRRRLEAYGDSIQDRTSPIGFNRSETLHFARWVLVDPPATASERPTQLVFCGSFDDIPPEERIREVVRSAAGALDEVYELCESYPAGPGRTDASREQFLRAHAIQSNAIFVGAGSNAFPDSGRITAPGRYRELPEFHDFTGRSPGRRYRGSGVRRARPVVAVGPVCPAPRRRTLLHLVLFGAGVLLLLPVIAAWLLVLRLRYERSTGHST